MVRKVNTKNVLISAFFVLFQSGFRANENKFKSDYRTTGGPFRRASVYYLNNCTVSEFGPETCIIFLAA